MSPHLALITPTANNEPTTRPFHAADCTHGSSTHLHATPTSGSLHCNSNSKPRRTLVMAVVFDGNPPRLDRISLMCSVVSAVLQVSLALVGWEVVEGLAEEVPEVFDGAMPGGTE